MLKFDIYLSLGMHGRLGREVIEQTEEIKKLCKIYGVTFYSPCDDEVISPNKIIDIKPNIRRMKWFVRKDDDHVDKCRALLLLTGDKASSGTLWECGRMHYRNKRPIVVIAPRMYHGLLANFTTVKATKICETPEQAIRWIKRNLKRRIK
jgi:nucleoside 2-deoxyribosyltransferase